MTTRAGCGLAFLIFFLSSCDFQTQENKLTELPDGSKVYLVGTLDVPREGGLFQGKQSVYRCRFAQSNGLPHGEFLPGSESRIGDGERVPWGIVTLFQPGSSTLYSIISLSRRNTTVPYGDKQPVLAVPSEVAGKKTKLCKDAIASTTSSSTAPVSTDDLRSLEKSVVPAIMALAEHGEFELKLPENVAMALSAEQVESEQAVSSTSSTYDSSTWQSSSWPSSSWQSSTVNYSSTATNLGSSSSTTSYGYTSSGYTSSGYTSSGTSTMSWSSSR